jgi:hypothetical protein
MGIRRRGYDLAAFVRAYAANQASRDEAAGVVQRWHEAIATGADIWWSPTIRAALVAGTPWLEVYCPGCQTSRAIDIRTIDRHPLASVGTLVLGLCCSWCPGSAPMPKIMGCIDCRLRPRRQPVHRSKERTTCANSSGDR